MRKSLIAALAGATLAAGAAHAQTTTIVNGTYTLPTGFQTFDFTVGSSGDIFREGAVIFNPADEGVGVLSSSNGYSEVFALTNGTLGHPIFNTFDLTKAGSYSFSFDFAQSNYGSGDQVGIDANITAVPEPATWAMLLTGLLAMACLARRAGGKSGTLRGTVTV